MALSDSWLGLFYCAITCMNVEINKPFSSPAQFPKELERISKVLRNLDLSNNKLPELPPVISLFSMLKSLNCDDNRIGERGI